MEREEAEFTQFFNQFFPRLCRFIECLLGGRGVAQEIAQESFLRLYRTGYSRFPEGEARFWLYRVARNLALNELRQRRTQHRLLEMIPDIFITKPPAPEQELELSEQQEIVSRMLNSLPEHQRSALVLREQEEMSYREIAEVLGHHENKVKADLFRARTALRRKMLKTRETATLRTVRRLI
jgi:RNA polymerase sigma factor (sigma-70 family)